MMTMGLGATLMANIKHKALQIYVKSNSQRLNSDLHMEVLIRSVA